MTSADNNGQRVLKTDINAAKIDALEKRVKELEDDLELASLQLARIGERLTLFQLAQGVYSSILAGIAAFLGRL